MSKETQVKVDGKCEFMVQLEVVVMELLKAMVSVLSMIIIIAMLLPIRVCCWVLSLFQSILEWSSDQDECENDE